MRTRAGLVALLFILGAGWGTTLPLGKVAVSEGYRSFGLIFWQSVVGAGLLGAILLLRRRLRRPTRRQAALASFVALVGTVLPNAASFAAVVHLPAGVMSIVIAAVPMIAFPMAIAIGSDHFSLGRLTGLVLGIGGVAILARPESLPGAASTGWLMLALVAPSFYAIEANVVARLGTFGLEPVAVLFWASLVGIVVTYPVALGTGTFIAPKWPGAWGAPDYALVALAVANAITYASYVWLLGRAGAVFAGQVGYLVTAFGVFWSIVFLNESYTGAFWMALALILSGVFLVQPRPGTEVAGAP